MYKKNNNQNQSKSTLTGDERFDELNRQTRDFCGYEIHRAMTLELPSLPDDEPDSVITISVDEYKALLALVAEYRLLLKLSATTLSDYVTRDIMRVIAAEREATKNAADANTDTAD